MLKPHQKIPEMPLISNLAPQRIFIKQEILDRDYHNMGSPRQGSEPDCPTSKSPYNLPNTNVDFELMVNSPRKNRDCSPKPFPIDSYDNSNEARLTIIDQPNNRNCEDMDTSENGDTVKNDIDVEASEDNETPLDLRVNFDRGSSPNRQTDRDSGTESDDTDDKLLIQDDADCKPYKKSLIKRCKSFTLKFCI